MLDNRKISTNETASEISMERSGMRKAYGSIENIL
jgi:hypothetical protein